MATNPDAEVIFGADFTPLEDDLDYLTGVIEDWADNAANLVEDAFGTGLFDNLIDSAEDFITSVQDVNDALESVTITAGDLESVAADVRNAIDDMATSADAIAEASDKAEEGIDKLDESIGDVKGDKLDDAAQAGKRLDHVMSRDLPEAGKKLEKAVKDPTDAIEKLTGKLDGWAKGTVAFVGAAIGAFAVTKIIDGMQAVTAAYNVQADAEAKLESVIRATGGAAGFTAEEMKKQAAELQNLTKFGDETTINAQALLATFKEVKGDNFIATTKAAADMATVLGTDLNGSVTMLGKALNEPVTGMGQLAEAGVGFTESQKKAITAMVEMGDVAGAQQVILKELEDQFGGAAEAAAGTFGGQMTQLNNVIGDVYETLGGMVADVLTPFAPVAWAVVDTISAIVAGMAEWTEQSDEFLGGVADNMLQWFEDMIVVGVDWYTSVETFFGNFGTIVSIAADSALLSMSTLFSDIIYFFTDTAPTYLDFFFENWQDIFTDIGNYVGTITTNMFDNFVNFIASITDYLLGDPQKYEFKALTEGFERTMKELPKIAAREMNPLEKELSERIAVNSDIILGDYEKRLEKNRAAFGIGDEGIEVAAEEQVKAAESLGDKINKALGNAKEKEAADKAVGGFQSLDQLLSRIQDSSANPDQKRAADATEELLAVTKQQFEESKKPKTGQLAVLSE